MRQQHGLVARARAHLQDAFVAGEMEELEVSRMHRWLRDGLPASYRQRRILIRAVAHAGRHEHVPWREIDCTQHGKVADTAGLQRFDETAPRAAKLGAYRSRHQLSADSSMSRCVRSR